MKRHQRVIQFRTSLLIISVWNRYCGKTWKWNGSRVLLKLSKVKYPECRNENARIITYWAIYIDTLRDTTVIRYSHSATFLSLQIIYNSLIHNFEHRIRLLGLFDEIVNCILWIHVTFSKDCAQSMPVTHVCDKYTLFHGWTN